MPAGLAQHPLADLHDHPRLFGDADELARSDQATLGVLPADERLEADDAVAADRDLGLEEHPELLAFQRFADRVLGMQPGQRALAGQLVEQQQPAAAGALGAVHRGVGVADQVLRLLLGVQTDRDADAGVGGRLAVGQVKRRRERLQHALGDGHRVLVVEDVLAQDHELVAAKAGQRLVAAEVVPDAVGDRRQQLIAGAVTEAVVDHLEAVQVEEQHRDRATR